MPARRLSKLSGAVKPSIKPRTNFRRFRSRASPAACGVPPALADSGGVPQAARAPRLQKQWKLLVRGVLPGLGVSLTLDTVVIRGEEGGGASHKLPGQHDSRKKQRKVVQDFNPGVGASLILDYFVGVVLENNGIARSV